MYQERHKESCTWNGALFCKRLKRLVSPRRFRDFCSAITNGCSLIQMGFPPRCFSNRNSQQQKTKVSSRKLHEGMDIYHREDVHPRKMNIMQTWRIRGPPGKRTNLPLSHQVPRVSMFSSSIGCMMFLCCESLVN